MHYTAQSILANINVVVLLRIVTEIKNVNKGINASCGMFIEKIVKQVYTFQDPVDQSSRKLLPRYINALSLLKNCQTSVHFPRPGTPSITKITPRYNNAFSLLKILSNKYTLSKTRFTQHHNKITPKI